MSRAGKLLFIAGIMIAFVSGLGVLVVLRLSQSRTEEPTTKLVIAFQNISPRTQIAPDQVGVTNWPRAVPTPMGGFEDPSKAIGKIATIPVYPGQPIISQVLIDKEQIQETHSNAALLLDKGTVAKSMPINLISGVADALQPGDRVDILATFRSPSTTTANATATQRLLADVLIMQVGPWPAPNTKAQAGGSASVITLQLKEQDALTLQFALESAASVSLVLRAANDKDLVSLEPVTFEYINQRFGYRLPR